MMSLTRGILEKTDFIDMDSKLVVAMSRAGSR